MNEIDFDVTITIRPYWLKPAIDKREQLLMDATAQRLQLLADQIAERLRDALQTTRDSTLGSL